MVLLPMEGLISLTRKLYIVLVYRSKLKCSFNWHSSVTKHAKTFILIKKDVKKCMYQK